MHDYIQSYLDFIDLKDLLKKLKVNGIEDYLEQVKRLSAEAWIKEELLLKYLKQGGAKMITDLILESLNIPLSQEIDVLDVGAGTNPLTREIIDRVKAHLPNASFFAMNPCPNALKALMSERRDIIPIVGFLEDIRGSVLYSSQYFALPDKFDIILLILTLNQAKDIKKALFSLRESIKDGGRVIVIDLCKPKSEELKGEAYNERLGYDPAEFQRLAANYFSQILIERTSGDFHKNSSISLFKAVLMP